MLRAIYDWTLSWAASRHAMWALVVVAFFEASVFPIPPDVLMIPMILARPARAWRVAAVATAASVAGAVLGYWIGAALWDSVGVRVMQAYGEAADFEAFASTYAAWGPWAVLVAGVTPFPFKVITIASGVAGLNLGVFVVAATAARALRFFLVAAILWYLGPPARRFVERHLALVFVGACILTVGGFLLIGVA
ncbi:MAG: YqaA family protein [Paracoccaceae bacterium]